MRPEQRRMRELHRPDDRVGVVFERVAQLLADAMMAIQRLEIERARELYDQAVQEEYPMLTPLREMAGYEHLQDAFRNVGTLLRQAEDDGVTRL